MTLMPCMPHLNWVRTASSPREWIACLVRITESSCYALEIWKGYGDKFPETASRIGSISYYKTCEGLVKRLKRVEAWNKCAFKETARYEGEIDGPRDMAQFHRTSKWAKRFKVELS